MRHASVRCTLDIYSQARAMEKRRAHERIVQMLRQDVEQNAPISVGQYPDARLEAHEDSSAKRIDENVNGAFWSLVV